MAPDLPEADLEAAARFLRSRPQLTLTTHVNPDGDGIASGLALATLVRQLGGEAQLLRVARG